jgi:hypothetical protein
MHTNILKYSGARHLWTSLGLVALSLAVFLTQAESKPPSGNTWQGYVLGGIATLLIVWLNLLGVRKRRYGVPGQVEGWLSAHVYFGVALFFIVLLHSAGQVGWNVHTAAFALMTIAILSGIVGTCFYLLVPPQMAEIRQGGSLQKLSEEVRGLNQACLDRATACASATALAIRSSIERTVIGGSVLDQLLARDKSSYLGVVTGSADDLAVSRPIPNRDQQAILKLIADRAPRAGSVSEAAALQDLVSLVARRQELLRRIRRSIRLQGLLQAWLYLHVPISIAVLFALLVHILVVFLYW